MSRTPIACRDCGDPTTRPSRCADCERVYQRARNNSPLRRPYQDPAYRAMVVAGLCYWGCGRPAVVKDHYIAIADGGTNDPSNIVGSCVPCNEQRRRRDR